MSHKSVFWSCLFGLALILAWRWDHRPLRHPPGPLVQESPVQEATDRATLRVDEFRLEPQAAFELRARILSSERYYLDAGAALAPVDLALGWGPMSDQAVLDDIEVSQSARWYRLRWTDTQALTPDVLLGHSGNMHLVPAEDWVEKLLKQARPGQVVRLRGLLVNARRDDGWTWQTSLSRDDTGDGSCELFYVEYAALEEG